MPTSLSYPCARREQLRMEEVNGEILIYDEVNQQASCLNPTASLIWKYCDGNTGAAEIASKLSDELGGPVDIRLVWFALEQLDKKNLLLERISVPRQYAHLTRRDFLTRAGVVGVAVAIPVVISLVAPTPAMAQTCTGIGLPNGSPCSLSSQCASCCCVSSGASQVCAQPGARPCLPG